MQSNIYIINSPFFPKKKDFDRFAAWCEWSEPDEVSYIKNICSSDQEYEEVIIKSYQAGKETYYPITETLLPNHEFMFVRVVVQFNQSTELDGYVSISGNEIVALSVWLNEDEDVTLLREDRLLAEDENPSAIAKLTTECNLEFITKIGYKSDYRMANGGRISGTFNFSVT